MLVQDGRIIKSVRAKTPPKAWSLDDDDDDDEGFSLSSSSSSSSICDDNIFNSFGVFFFLS